MLTALDQLSQLYTQYTTDVDTVLVYCLDQPVADPGIDKRGGGGRRWLLEEFIHNTAGNYML